MHTLRKYLPLGLFIAFSALSILTFLSSKPTPKNERIYNTVQKYSPYYLEKRLGGLTIKNREDKNFKEKPTNMTIFKEFERLERTWGRQHLTVKNNTLIIQNSKGQTQESIPIHSDKELAFIHTYYEVH